MNEKIKKIENLNDEWITYFATENGFDFDAATEIVNTLIQQHEIKTFSVYTILFFGYEHEVLKEDIDNISECLEVFTEYKLALTEIQYSSFSKEITLLFE